MLQKIINKINSLVNQGDKILLTVSGGPDSAAMTDIFYKAGYTFDIAHCNFMLRGQDSDDDEKFVNLLAYNYKAKIHSKKCETKNFAAKNRLSIEMAARQLRYQWFEELSQKFGYTKIATAHNLDDNVETILLNLTHKTGLRGLIGIPEKNGKIIRPMLEVSKKEILEYLKQNILNYRFDKTNAETKFQRNKIRHLIIPQFQQLNPAFLQNVIDTASNIKQYYDLFNNVFQNFKTECVKQKDNEIEIDLNLVSKYQPVKLFLFEYLNKFGFNATQVEKITSIISANSSESKTIQTSEYQLFINKNKITLLSLKSLNFANSEYLINQEDINKDKIFSVGNLDQISLKFQIIDAQNYKIEKNSKIGAFDFDKLNFPLKLRKWGKGDYFIPLGMKGKKKLSDFFADQKLRLIDKKKVWLLESDGEIMWIVGFRIDNRFKITEKTKKVLRIE